MGNLAEELNSIILPHNLFEIKLFGVSIPVSDTVITMWLVMAILIILSLIFVRNFKLVPEGKQNVAETIVETINNIVKDAIGHNWRPFAPYMGTILLFLLFSNIISIFNIVNSISILSIVHLI